VLPAERGHGHRNEAAASPGDGHNLPINSIIKTTLLHDPDGDGGALPLIRWDDTVRASDNGNVVMWRTVQVNTANIPNGPQGVPEPDRGPPSGWRRAARLVRLVLANLQWERYAGSVRHLYRHS